MSLGLSAAPSEPDLSWLAGYWLSCDGGREVSETWSDPRAGVLANTTVTVAAGLASIETARIAETDGVITFHAQPDGQPPAAFQMIGSRAGEVTFANPAHDFPQRITYARQGDVLTARIEGRIDGQIQGMEWRYVRAELNARCPA
jgi:hypothetical protein